MNQNARETAVSAPDTDPPEQYTLTQMQESLDNAYRWLSEARTERDEAREKVKQLREERDAYGDTLAGIAEDGTEDPLTNLAAAVVARMVLDQRGYLPFGRVKVMTQAWQEAEAQRDEARRDLAAATTTLERIRDLCDEAQPLYDGVLLPVGKCVFESKIRAVLDAAGDDSAATGGETHA